MTHYDTLDVGKDASDEEIKKAFKRKAMKTHPDRGGDLGEFQAVQKAYEVLSDPDRRAHYDASGEDEKPRGPNPLEVISQVFSQIVESGVDIVHTDLMTHLRNHFKTVIQQFDGQIRKARDSSKRWKNVKKRLKVPKDSPLYNVCQGKRGENWKTYRVFKQQKALAQSCLKMMKDWKYMVEPMAGYRSAQAQHSAFSIFHAMEKNLDNRFGL